MYRNYSTLRDLHFSLPGGWNDKNLKIFIQACRIHIKDFKLTDNCNKWQKISEFGAESSENPTLFTVNSCIEVAQSIRSYIERNRTKKANDSIFNYFLSDFEDLIEYFPTQPKIIRSRSLSTENIDDTNMKIGKEASSSKSANLQQESVTPVDKLVDGTLASRSAVGAQLQKKSGNSRETVSCSVDSTQHPPSPAVNLGATSSQSNKPSKLFPVEGTVGSKKKINLIDKQKYKSQELQTSTNCTKNDTNNKKSTSKAKIENPSTVVNSELSESMPKQESISLNNAHKNKSINDFNESCLLEGSVSVSPNQKTDDKQRPFKKRGISTLINEVLSNSSSCIESINDVVAFGDGNPKRVALENREEGQEPSLLPTSDIPQHPTDPIKETPEDESESFKNDITNCVNIICPTTEGTQSLIKRKRGRPPKNDKIVLDTKSHLFQPGCSGSIVDKNRPFKKRDISQFHQEMVQQENVSRPDDSGKLHKNNEIASIGESKKRKIKCGTETKNKRLISPKISKPLPKEGTTESEINFDPVVKLIDIISYPNAVEKFHISKYTQMENEILIRDKISSSSAKKNNIQAPDQINEEHLSEITENESLFVKVKRKRGRLSKQELEIKTEWEMQNLNLLIEKTKESKSLLDLNLPFPKWFQKKWGKYEFDLRMAGGIPVWQPEYIEDWKCVVQEWNDWIKEDMKNINHDMEEDLKQKELLREREERVKKREKARELSMKKDNHITPESRKSITEKEVCKILPEKIMSMSNELCQIVRNPTPAKRLPPSCGAIPRIPKPGYAVLPCETDEMPNPALLALVKKLNETINETERSAGVGASGTEPRNEANIPIDPEEQSLPVDTILNRQQILILVRLLIADYNLIPKKYNSVKDCNWFKKYMTDNFSWQKSIVQQNIIRFGKSMEKDNMFLGRLQNFLDYLAQRR